MFAYILQFQIQKWRKFAYILKCWLMLILEQSAQLMLGHLELKQHLTKIHIFCRHTDRGIFTCLESSTMFYGL